MSAGLLSSGQHRTCSRLRYTQGMNLSFHPLSPVKPFPPLTVPLVGGEPWTLSDQRPNLFTLVVFYRTGLPGAAKYLRELERLLPEFESRGVQVVAISRRAGQAEQARQNWKLDTLKVGYDLPLEVARRWGLYLSASRGRLPLASRNPPSSVNQACT